MPSPPRTSPDAVLFDLDGTLIDSIELILRSAEFAFAKCGVACPTRAQWLEGVGRPLPTMFAKFASGGQTEVDALILAYREFQMANHDSLVTAYPGISELLEGLVSRGHRLAVVTSKTGALAARGLGHTGIAHHFQTVVGMDASQRHKPHPEPVLIALDRLGVSPGAAWFVGDSVHDMESGNAAGVSTIGALWGPFSADDLAPSNPRHLAHRAGDVLTIVGKT
jgi:pyrophosphatase PpaX